MKRTKTKLVSSIVTLLICFAMLIGSTFAWFTDSASTGVNKIQAGNLDVQLLAKDGTTSIEGGSLKWVKADGHTEEQVLWEPGATYKLESFRIKNNGNLKLKYKINISGITGDALLLNALDFVVEGVPSLSSLSDLNGFEGALEPNTTSPAITIKATMKRDAGNEYQGLSIENIDITVQATQLGGQFSGVNGENDSFNNTYDENATYPPLASYLNNTVKETVTLDNQGKTGSAETIISDGKATSIVPAETFIYGTDTNTPVATDDSGTLNRSIKTTASTSESVTYDISYNYVNANGISKPVVKFGNVVENVIDVSTGLEVVKVTHTHDDVTREMVLAGSKDARVDGYYYYDSLEGKIYVWSSEYSEFKVDYKSDYAAATGGQGYATLEEAVKAVKDNGTVILLKNVDIDEDLKLGSENKNINFDLNGKTIDCGTNQVYTAGEGTIKIYGDGTIKNNNTVAGNAAYAALNIYSGSKVVLDGVTVEGYYGVYTCGNLTINEATINAFDCGIAVNGSAQVNVGTESKHNISVNASNGNCISTQAANGNGSMVVNIHGGTFISSGTNWAMCPIYWASHGTLNVYGGSFVNSTSGTEAAGLYQKNGTVNIHNGTFESRCGLKIGAEESNSTEIEMNISDGIFTGTNHAALYFKTTSNGSNCTRFNINVSGGTFNGVQSKGSISKSLASGVITPSVSVTGGEFSSDPRDYVANNYEAVLKENGKWLVETYKVAYINGKGYETLNDAFADVNRQSTDDVTLYIRKDIIEELNDDYSFNKNLKIESIDDNHVTVNLGFNYPGSILFALIPFYGHTLEIGSNVTITNLGQLFSGYNPTDMGDKLIINGEAYLQQLWAYGGGTIDINPEAKVIMGYGDGMIKMRYDSTINVTGEVNDANNMNLSGGYISGDYSGSKVLNLKDTYVKTAWVVNNDNNASGSFDIYLDNSTLYLTGSESTGLNLGTNSNNTIYVKNNSKIITKSCKNIDTLIIDVLGLLDERELVIDYQGSSTIDSDYYGQIDIINGDYHSEIIDNDLYVVKNS